VPQRLNVHLENMTLDLLSIILWKFAGNGHRHKLKTTLKIKKQASMVENFVMLH
jgi:hypothetical protein